MYHSHSFNTISQPSDQQWDAFVASLHRVWEFAPDFSLEGHLSLAGRTVLVFDSDPRQNSNLSDQFTNVGLQARSATTYSHALGLLKKNEFDIVIIVDRQQNHEGTQVCEFVADSERHAHVAVLVLSNEDSADAIWRWRKLGAKYFLRLPYDPYVLLTLMAASVEQTRA
jgi:DNA-binding response OmpR family regulator